MCNNDEFDKYSKYNAVFDIYFKAERDQNFPTQDLHQLALQFNLDLAENFYLAGQTAFASFGNAGAYAEGIVGMGLKSNRLLNKKINLFTQRLYHLI